MLLAAMAWRNLWRHWTRSLLTALAMGMGMGVCMAIMALYAGMFGTLREVMIQRQIGHVQVHEQAYVGRRGMYDAIPDAAAVVEAADALPESAGVVARLYGQALLGTEEKTTGATLTGVQPARERDANALHDIVEAGRFLDDAPGLQILVGQGLADELGVEVGDQLVAVTQDAMGGIGNNAYTVVGTFESGDPMMDRAGAYLHMADLQALLALDDRIHELRVTTTSDDDAQVQALVDALERRLPEVLGPDEALAVRPWWEVNPMASQMFGMQGVSTAIILFVVFGLAAIGVVNTMLMSVLERTRELGVARAIGMRPGEVIRLILIEATFLGLVGAALGLSIGLGLDAWLVLQGLDFSVSEGEGFAAGGFALPPTIYGRITVDSVVQPLVGAMVFAVLAAVYPAVRAARLQPVDALRAE